MTVRLQLQAEHDTKPTLGEAAALLGVPEEALDAKFGVVLVEPRKNLYVVLSHAPGAAGGFPGREGDVVPIFGG